MELLRTRELTFSYSGADRPALRGVEFSLCDGELLLLYGSSGSGKTTLLRMLKPELAPSGERSGSLLYCGEDISALTTAVSAAEIGFVGQDPNASPVTEDVLGELAFLPENLGRPRSFIMRRIAELSAYLGLEPLIGRKICELSAGQKQLVNLAAVMTVSPKLLLLDEPTAQLDPHSSQIFIERLMKIRSELGTAMIVCEHSAEGIFSSCDKILHLEDGVQRSLLPPAESARALLNEPMGAGVPCCYRLSAALGLNEPLIDTASAKRFVAKNFAPETAAQSDGTNDDSAVKTPAVTLDGVWFRYGRNTADVLRGAALSFAEGSVTAVCGANGTGKSTLLKLIAGVYSAQSGTVRVFGERVGGRHSKKIYRGTLAMLPQDPSALFTEKTVFDDLRRDPDGERRSDEDILAVTRSLGLSDDLLGRYFLDLSGGELQRAALARLLLGHPRLLLLDEPEKGLDCLNKRRFTEIIRRFADGGGTVIFVTHDLDFAAAAADSAVMMFGGECAVSQPMTDFLAENELYTTAAARIAGRAFPRAVTTEQLIESCLKEGERK